MSKRIYVCDPNRDTLEYFITFFHGSTDFEVYVFKNPEKLPIRPPHMLIIDGVFISKIKEIAKNYPSTFIVCSAENANFGKIKREYGGIYVQAILRKPYTMYDVLEELQRLSPNASAFRISGRDVEEKVSNLLIRAGISPHLKGYGYLREAVMMMLEDPEKYAAVTKNLYPEIAKKHNTNDYCVERAMRFVINLAWERGRLENVNSALGIKIFSRDDKPTNGELIAVVADKLSHEMKHFEKEEEKRKRDTKNKEGVDTEETKEGK